MLVLARKKGQSIVIGDNIKITVLEVTGETVRLGIEAPPEVDIFREELYLEIKRENLASVAGASEMSSLFKFNKRT